MKLFKHTYQIFQVSLVALMILLSGSTMVVISSFLNEDHECCCCNKNPAGDSDASLKCNKDCCTLVETREHPLEESIPVTNVKTKISDETFTEFTPVIIHFTQTSFIAASSHYKPQKIYLSISVIRI